MKDQKFGPIPVLFTLAGGLAGFVLRLMMLTVGYDAQGVQIPGSWPMVSLWVLSGVVLIGLAALCLGMGKRAGLEENFKASPVAGAGAMVAGLVFFVCSLVQLLDKPDLFPWWFTPWGWAVGPLWPTTGTCACPARSRLRPGCW
ncbi:MAG: hypothetical protein ACLU9S_18940 [Oscillospiraceae bacterium]